MYKELYHSPQGMDKFLGFFSTVHDGPFRINEREVEQAKFFPLEEVKSMKENAEKFHPELVFLLEKRFRF